MRYLLFILFIPAIAFSQNKNFTLNKGEIIPKEYFEEIPFEFIKGQAIINVSINGELYRFSLDTGAPTSVSNELFDKLQLPVINKLNIIDANNENDSINVVVLKSLIFGDVEIEETAALVLSSDNLIFKCLNIDGNIGSNSLRNSIVQFCLPEKIVRLTNSKKKLDLKRVDSQKMMITSNQSSPLLWIRLEGNKKGRLLVLFDSGMEGLLDISLDNFKTLNQYDIFKDIKSSIGNNSISVFKSPNDTLHYKITVPRMNFGEMELRNVIATTTKSNNSRIGTKILEYAIVTLDYKKSRIYFTPIGNKNHNAFEKTFPVQPNYKDGKFQVGFIWSPEKVPNISLGDRILFIDEMPCKEKSICELLLRMDSIDKDEIKIITEDRDGKENTSIIKRE